MKLSTRKIGVYSEVPVHLSNQAVKAIPEDTSEKKYTLFKDDDVSKSSKYHFL